MVLVVPSLLIPNIYGLSLVTLLIVKAPLPKVLTLAGMFISVSLFVEKARSLIVFKLSEYFIKLIELFLKLSIPIGKIISVRLLL